MKLHFEPDLDFQLEAIEAVCDLFRGQEVCRTEFTVTRNTADAQAGLGFAESDLGTGNRLSLPDDQMLENLKAVQLRRGFEVNTLTVIATESYEEFAENLQQEIETDTGIRFGVVEAHQFATIPVVGPDGQTSALGSEASKNLWEHLKAAGYIDAAGGVQDTLREALKDDTLSLPEEFAGHYQEIAKVLGKFAGRLVIKNADERRSIRPRQAVLQSPEFQALWDRIKHKTTYRVEFNNEALLAQCIRAIGDAPPIPRPRLQWRKAGIAIAQAGVEATERAGAATVVLDEADVELPDILTELQDRTQLTRRSIQRILRESGRLDDFKRNPQQFIELAAQTINRCKRLALVEGVKYQRLGNEYYYAQELFSNGELTGYLKNMLSDTTKSVHDQVVYDSEIEKSFADQLEKNTEVKVYAKLPGWFTVPTPLGTYNPDWAVLVERDEGERLYLVVETKASLFSDDLRSAESARIKCGKAHFNALKVGGGTGPLRGGDQARRFARRHWRGLIEVRWRLPAALRRTPPDPTNSIPFRITYRLNRLLRPTLLHSGQVERSWLRAGQCSRPK